MKRAEQLAWAAVAGLVTIFAILLTGGLIYKFTAFWAGMLMVAMQALVVGLAAWGLRLARELKELNELPPLPGEKPGVQNTSFRMSLGDDAPAAARNKSAFTTPTIEPSENDVQTLAPGFQRLIVFLSAFLMLLAGIVASLLVFRDYRFTQNHPDQVLPIAGTFDAPRWMDELSLVIGLGAAGIYGILYKITRPTRQTVGFGDATSSTFSLGLTGMVALAVATVLGYLRVTWASEIAAGVIAFFMLLQCLELFVNSFRSYSSIEELDQEAVDLQALPLVPMLSSEWLNGLRMLFAASVGLSGQAKHERGVFARMMPRTIVALIVIAIGVSCIRVVQPGQVAVLERLGYAPTDANGKLLPAALLNPGPHLTFPWPIDELVTIPTRELQTETVGTELHVASGAWKNVDFQFWTVRPPSKDADESNDLFITGDPGSPQFLETYIEVRWRVSDPLRFYSALSHSDFYQKSEEATAALPIYKALVQECTSFAVTRAFAIHTLDQILVTQRQEVEQHTRQILQDKLDALCALPGDKPDDPHRAIEIVFLTIKDLHPPFWRPDRFDPSKQLIGGNITQADGSISVEDNRRTSRMSRGPASAFELVVSMREFKEQLINEAQKNSIERVNLAQGEAKSMIANAEAERLNKVAQAHSDADRLMKMTEGLKPEDQRAQLDLMEQRALYDTVKDLFDPVNKIIADPDAGDLQLIQNTEKNSGSFRPPGN